MNILVYANAKDKETKSRLIMVIESKVPHKKLEVIHTLAALEQRSRRFPRNMDIAVLLAQNTNELEDIVSLRTYLEGSKKILILPDNKKETFSKGCRIRPTYIDYTDATFQNIGSVLGKICS